MKSRLFCVPILMVAVALTLGGCDTLSSWFSSNGRVSKLRGTRVPVMAATEDVSQDPTIKNTPVILPPPYVNAEWPSQGGYPSNAMYHLKASGPLEKIWSSDAGEGSSSDSRVMAEPVVGGGMIYTMDAAARVFAFDPKTGDEKWHKYVANPGHTDLSYALTFGLFGEDKSIDTTKAFGGGITYDNGKLFATDGFGDLVAFDAKTGNRLWGINLGVPVFDAPVANGGRVFVASQDNHFHAYAETNGRELWDHQGITESAGIMVSTSAAVSGEFVVIPYTSGELYAIRVQNGRPAWSDMLTRTGNVSALSTLDDIAARPVIDRDMVFAVSHSGVMAAISLDSGERAWTRDIGGIQTPWVAGDYVYVLTGDSRLMCLTRKEGRIKWITNLPKLFDPTDVDSDPVTWSGPVLVSDRLLVVSTGGKVMSVSPYTGAMMGEKSFYDGFSVSPVVANETVYLLSDTAELFALK